MRSIRYIYWQDGDIWLAYLEESPHYMTQGASLEDLEDHLRDLYQDLASGAIPSVRKVAELPML
jgi:predicted RNase H-like HicB family nuclease